MTLLSHQFRYREQLQVPYSRVLLPVEAGGTAAVRDEVSGALLPVQVVPALPSDRVEGETVAVALVSLAPGAEIALTPVDDPAPAETLLTVAAEGDWLVIRNGRRAVRVPATGLLEQPFPGPIGALQLDGGDWFGESLLVDTPCRGFVETIIESLGPCCVQWRTAYRWGNDGGVTVRARWAAGADTIQIVEEVRESCDAAVEWYPFGPAPAQAWQRGERGMAMSPISYPPAAEARRGQGRRRLQSISHIAYFNQWNLAWAGFTAEGDRRFAGLFSGWGSRWKRRGHLRIEVYQDDARGCFLRFPMKAGRRLYGIVFTDKDAALMSKEESPCLLNRRKTQLADLALPKVCQWALQPPLEAHRPHLVRAEDLAGFRERVAADPALTAAFANCLALGEDGPARFALALWQDDTAALRAEAATLRAFAEKFQRDTGLGGYERLGIFDGRSAKFHAYHLDLLWAQELISEEDYRAARQGLLAMAYMYADPDFTRYPDFWAHTEPDSGMVEALKDDMGDCPVPPNFCAEFYTTTGVMAELFPSHPLCDTWRQWTLAQHNAFLDTYFTPEGTYLEAVNYHVHMFNELLCYLYPAAINGVHDAFADPRVRGSFEHFVRIQLPAPATNTNPLKGAVLRDDWGRWVSLIPGRPDGARALLPANGNSGGEGFEQEHGGELALGAAIYRQRDPQLAGALMAAWVAAGKPMLDHVHPLLSLLTVDPSIPAMAPPAESVWRKSLGVVCRAAHADGTPIYGLFRAGNGTHHMDYDQGSLHLVLGDAILLGEFGYHCHDSAEKNLICHETWLHSTVVYAEDKHRSSGYTGLERAPEPALVHLGEDFDWVMHRIVNTNYRDVSRFWYNVLLPTPTTCHVRHVLFVKPNYFLVWDVFEAAHQPSLFFLHPRLPLRPVAPGRFQAGEAGTPHLVVQFLLPAAPEVVESEQVGPLWSFAIRNATAQPYLTLLVPQVTDRAITAILRDERTVHVTGQGIDDTLRLPEPGSLALPEIIRR